MLGLADVAPGARGGDRGRLDLPAVWQQGFDPAPPRNIWFRRLFQDLLGRLQSVNVGRSRTCSVVMTSPRAGTGVWGED